MTRKHLGDRRRFVRGAGAALLAPLGVGTIAAAEREPGDAALHERVRRLETKEQVRRLYEAYFHHVGAGELERAASLFLNPEVVLDEGVRRLWPASQSLDDGIEVSDDGAQARVRLQCTAEVLSPIESDCTLVQMARQQGGGTVRSTEARVLDSVCVRLRGHWRIAELHSRPA